MPAKIYVGAILKIEIEVAGADLTATTTRRIAFRRPDDTRGTWPASLTDTNVLTYTTVKTDLAVAGVWKLQPDLPDDIGLGDTVDLPVHGRFT